MCGRYTVTTKAEALEARFHAQAPAHMFAPSYNAAPSHDLPAILNANPHAITLGAWGFLPEWAEGRRDVKPLINARAETVAIKPFFRQAFRSRRCLVLATGFTSGSGRGRARCPTGLP